MSAVVVPVAANQAVTNPAVTNPAGTGPRASLERVFDPEIPVLTIGDLGVLRTVTVDQAGHVEVVITPTYSGCPAMDAIRDDIVTALATDGFTDVTVRRPDVISLRDRIRPIAEADMARTEAVAMARLRDGREVTVRVTAATGTPGNPISDDELREKFLDLVEPLLGRAAGEHLADLVDRLDTLDDVGLLVNATTPSQS